MDGSINIHFLQQYVKRQSPLEITELNPKKKKVQRERR
jgi:hypothetical protein